MPTLKKNEKGFIHKDGFLLGFYRVNLRSVFRIVDLHKPLVISKIEADRYIFHSKEDLFENVASVDHNLMLRVNKPGASVSGPHLDIRISWLHWRLTAYCSREDIELIDLQKDLAKELQLSFSVSAYALRLIAWALSIALAALAVRALVRTAPTFFSPMETLLNHKQISLL